MRVGKRARKVNSMLGATILAGLIAFFAIMIPGFLLAIALLRRTNFSIFEISVMGFIFGFIAAPIMTWAESYLMNYIHFFSYSMGLYLFNTLVLTIIGAILCVWLGVFKNFKEDYLTKKAPETIPGTPEHRKHTKNWVWLALLALMLLTFVTRLQSIGITPTFYEFDPYYDMIDTQYILTYGQELLLDKAAWPSIAMGTNHRVEPIVPYIESFWYDISNSLGPHYTYLSTTLLSNVSGVYPPIAAALLVFVVFMLIYHEYDEKIALIAGGIAATMPILYTTFIAGEQLVEPWGIFALFFFIATYLLAAKDPKNKSLAILAGIAFVANFMGAHYYTVTAGVLVLYILLQGGIDIIRGDTNKDFFKMNAIVIAIIAIFMAIYLPWGSTLQNRIPTVVGVPLTVAGPALALVFVWVADYLARIIAPKIKSSFGLVVLLDVISVAGAFLLLWALFKDIKQRMELLSRYAVLSLLIVIAALVLLFTPLGSPIRGYLSLSTKFTTPSSALFMTVEEYIPTGLGYNFNSAGLGAVSGLFGITDIMYVVMALSFALIILSIITRKSKTGIMYFAIAAPLTFAGFSEVKYLPHFAVAYIMLFGVMLGELMYLAEHHFRLTPRSPSEVSAETHEELLAHTTSEQKTNTHYQAIILAVGLFFFSTFLALVYLIYLATGKVFKEKTKFIWATAVILIALMFLMLIVNHALPYGESSSFFNSLSAGITAAGTTNQTQLCNTFSNEGDSLAYNIYCNVVPPYWLNAMAWISQNVGPDGPRVLAWWDYGDWINWFGNSNAVLRGDNANATEDYATAAHYVLGDKFGPASLAQFMNGNQSKYVLFDQDLIQKWGALDFLGCIYVNETSYKFAVAAGQSQNPPQPYALGTSQCELDHDPQMALIPLAALVGNSTQQNINYYCTISNSTALFVQTPLVTGSSIANQTVCTDITPNKNGVLQIYNQSGKKLNAVLQSTQYQGVVTYEGVQFVEYMMIYLPNGPNDTITNAPSNFYTSNYYKGFILGNLPGFTEVYPAGATGMINFVNGTYGVRIYEVNNFTGTLPGVAPKPSWITNNYTIPG